jgi:multidrug efflux pump subunit AcrB
LARINGRPAVVVGVRARQGLRVDLFGNQVLELLDNYRQTLPEDVECHVFHDLARYTRQRMSELSRTLALSIAFVFLSTAVFMGWRGAVVVTAAIPLTGLIVLIIFHAMGLPLDQMSVMAIVMAFGLLVDDAIVVTEQIHRRCSQGVAVQQAATDEPAGLSMPLIVTTLTTLAAFLPIYLLPGGVGEFVRAIPLGMAVCLLVAMLVAMTVIPWLCLLLFKDPLRGTSPHADPSGPFARLARSAANLYRGFLKRCVAWPVGTLFLVALVMLSLSALGLTLRRDFFSPVQRDQFVVDVFAPQGTALADTAGVVREIEEIVAQDEKVVSTASFVGRNAPLVFYNLESQETYANHFAQIIVNVADWRWTTQTAQRIQTELGSRVPGAECCVHILEHGAPFVAPFEVRISGPSITTLRELGRRATDEVKEAPGVRNVRNNYGNEALKLTAQVNEPVAVRIGMDQSMVADQLRYRLDGLVVGQLREDDERIEISLRLPLSGRGDAADLNSIYFKPTPASKAIPFAAVAKLVPRWEAASIYRRDGQRTLSVLAYPDFGLTPAEVSRNFAPRLASLSKRFPPGYSLQLGGENEQRNEAETNLLKNAVYAVFVILLLLMIEFHSFRLSLIILALLPLSLGGAMPALFLTGWPLNFMALMGIMILFGVVVNDAVVLVDGYEKRRRAGEAVATLVVAGTLERSRHVVITTFTTIAGFLPLALSPSLLWPPLALVVIGGLAVATLITLLAIPAAYALLFRRK